LENRIDLIVSDRGWILEAIAYRWKDELSKKGMTLEVIPSHSRVSANVVVHFIYLNAVPISGKINIVYITHLDTVFKILKVLFLARKSNVSFIAMSSQMKSFLSTINRKIKVSHVLEPSIHFDIANKKNVTVGLFFRTYNDGRKREDLIAELFQMTIVFDNLHILAYGQGFSQVEGEFNDSNISIDETGFDVDTYRKYISCVDYVLYYGNDEGAISVLDASALAKPILAVAQGYHLDIGLAKGSVLFQSADEINVYLRRLLKVTAPTSLVETIHNHSKPSKGLDWISFIISVFKVWFLSNPFGIQNQRKESIVQIFNTMLRRLKF
jgi:hypothetical protein